MAMTDGAMPVAMMERRLLNQRGAVCRVNAGERNGIRRTRRAKSDCSESRCGQDRLHVIFLLEAASWCGLSTLLHDVGHVGMHTVAVPPNADAALDRLNQPKQCRAPSGTYPFVKSMNEKAFSGLCADATT